MPFDAASVGGAVLGAFALKYGYRALAAWDVRAERRHAMRPSDVHGRSKLGTLKDAKAYGLLVPGGTPLGRLKRRQIYAPADVVNMVNFGPPGSGKSTTMAIPALLEIGRPGTHSEGTSIFALDISGEITAVVARRFRERGYRVVVLNGYREKLIDEIGVDLGDDGLQLCAFLQPGLDVKDDCELLALLLIPGQARMSGNEQFFIRFGRDIFAAFLLYLVSRVPERVTLPELRRLLMLPPTEFENLLDEMILSNAFSGVIREYAGKLLATFRNAPEEFQGGLSTAQAALSIYDGHSPLGRHVSKKDGLKDFGELLDRPTIVLVVHLSDRSAQAAYLNLVVSLAIEQVARRRQNKPVYFQIDEAAHLGDGYCPSILRAMGAYRKNGLRVSTWYQSTGQILRAFGRDGLRDFMAMSDVVTASCVQNDFDTLELLSKLSGQNTAKDFSHNLRPDSKATEFGEASFGASDRGVPLLRPEDIRTMPANKQLIFYKNAPPFMAEKMSYLDHRSWRRQTDPNPYYRR